jgi:hypothetical protein
MLNSSFQSHRFYVHSWSVGLAFFVFSFVAASAQSVGRIEGKILDPSGAVIPGAKVSLTSPTLARKAESGGDGSYVFSAVPAGAYVLDVSAKGFASFSQSGIVLAEGEVRHLIVSLTIAVERQQVTVKDESQTVGLSPDQNASAMVIKGRDLDALSDDPDELQNELQALAGPAAGPNGGEIYIDGFSGGQLPPKSSILEIRANQNPFSAEFDRIGYGRIEIITKPGTQKLHGSISDFGTDSVLNTADPLLPYKPSYSLSSYSGNFNGPLTKNSSYFLNFFQILRQAQNVVNAVNPQNTSANLQEAFPNSWNRIIGSARVDFQAGNRNTLTVRDSYWRSAQTGTGVGTLNLPSQASNTLNQENTIQVGDTILANERLVTDIRLQWRRLDNSRSAVEATPTVTVEGAFTDGGSSSGSAQDHQDDFELQETSTAMAGRHTLRFGADARIYRDSNYSTSGANGTYMFTNLIEYQAAQPALYSATVISNPSVRAVVFDGSLFIQDDWKAKPNLVVGLGLRFEGQNWIEDHDDWAPRLAFAWSPGYKGNGAAKTVVRAGYGWFYTRFTVPNSFSSFSGTPYAIQVLHDNLINQRSYTIANPGFYDPNATEPPGVVISAPSSIPTYHTIDPHFHAAIDMQSGIGVDRQLTKKITGNVTYLYTQGVHQYLSNNVTAPAFDPSTYTITRATPSVYNYQYQSGGVYRQNQIITTLTARLKSLTANLNYTYNTAKSDTQGVNSFVSDSQDPGLDYGRATFGIRHQVSLIGSYSAPRALTLAAIVFAQAGTPYNLTIGSDLTGNDQFNARPAYGTCGDPGVVATHYGCLDADPVSSGERIVPYGVGIGPANSIVILRASKVIGIGPHLKQASNNDDNTIQSSGSVQRRGLSGGGAAIPIDATAPRKFSLTLSASAINAFNQVNFAPQNGVLESPLFNQSQSLAGGQFGNPFPANRAILLESTFSF